MTFKAPMDPRTPINWSGFWLTVALPAMLAYCLWALMTLKVPGANRDALMVLIGVLSRDFATVVNFHFSSTAQAKKQTDIMESQAKSIEAAQAALPPVAGAEQTIVVAPGQQASVAATADGAVIEKTDLPAPTPESPKS